MDEQQLLRDSSIDPTSDVIANALGEANGTYVKFIEGLENHDVQVDWRYYNDGKAWLGKGLYKWTTVRGTQKEMTTFWLSIWQGFFKITVYIPEKARTDALNLPLYDTTKEAIENAKQMGKLKFFPLAFDLRSDSDELFDEIYTLVEFKKTVK